MSGRAALLLLVVIAAIDCRLTPAATSDPVRVPAGVVHADWGRLVEAYVDERGLVAYARWRSTAADREALARYLEQFAREGPPAQGPELIASAINAYNAFTIGWVLDHYPTTSIRAMKDSFTAPRHPVGGRSVSLDDLEHRTLRPLAGYRVHAALVCAARSCPPLHREAYLAHRLDRQLDDAMARWLARTDLNRFHPERGRAEVSRIFDWFEEDFTKAGGLRAVLRRHGPPAARQAAERPDLRIEYLPYDWALNDQGGVPPAPGGAQSLWSRLRDLVRGR